MVYIVERLTLRSLGQMWWSSVWRSMLSGGLIRIRYFSSSRTGVVAFKLLRRLRLVDGELLRYSYLELRDETGALIGTRVETADTLASCGAIRRSLIEDSPLLRHLERRFNGQRLRLFLEKCLAESLTPTLMRINVVRWVDQSDGHPSCLFLERRPWYREVECYAARLGVRVRWYRGGPCLGVLRALASVLRRLARGLRDGWRMRSSMSSAHYTTTPDACPRFAVAVPYSGKGLGLDLSRNSDLFWVPFTGLPSEVFLVYFWRPDDPLDPAKYDRLQHASMRAVALSRTAVTSDLPVWKRPLDLSRLRVELFHFLKGLFRTLWSGRLFRTVEWWIAACGLQFIIQYISWRAFFEAFQVRVHVDLADWVKERLASDQALEDLGGISVAYQRSEESFASMFRASAVDVHFAFSHTSAQTERQSRSSIPQFIASGYIHDHAFSRVRERAAQLRTRLQDHGARFILCFFDENSHEDERLGPSHAFRSENCRYLLGKLLADPSLGLVFKPKKPTTVRQRLGEVGALFDAALATGRCVLVEEGIVATPMLPCEAARAADVAIGLLYGSTAAMESALAGTPTLLLDREHLRVHSFYALGEGRVVFKNWDQLWNALMRYRTDPASVPGFGDWSALLARLDPFRDGRAAERIGTYIGWLGEALKQGSSRDAAMESARQRYLAAWGVGTVISVRDHAGDPQGAPERRELHDSGVGEKCEALGAATESCKTGSS